MRHRPEDTIAATLAALEGVRCARRLLVELVLDHDGDEGVLELAVMLSRALDVVGLLKRREEEVLRRGLELEHDAWRTHAQSAC